MCSIALALLLTSTAPAADTRTKTTEVVVYNGDGTPASGRRVSMGFTSALGGVTGSFYTDSKGTAWVKHASEGSVDVYVDGSKRTSGRAPGRLVVYLPSSTPSSSGLKRAATDFAKRLTKPSMPPTSSAPAKKPSLLGSLFGKIKPKTPSSPSSSAPVKKPSATVPTPPLKKPASSTSSKPSTSETKPKTSSSSSSGTKPKK